MTNSGAVAGPSTARRAQVARASRIWVEGRHDAELLQHVWGDELAELAIVVEPMHGIDGLVDMVAEFEPSSQRRLGILVDHLVAGSKEERITRSGGRPPCAGDRPPLRRCVGGRAPAGDGSRPSGPTCHARSSGSKGCATRSGVVPHGFLAAPTESRSDVCGSATGTGGGGGAADRLRGAA